MFIICHRWHLQIMSDVSDDRHKSHQYGCLQKRLCKCSKWLAAHQIWSKLNETFLWLCRYIPSHRRWPERLLNFFEMRDILMVSLIGSGSLRAPNMVAFAIVAYHCLVRWLGCSTYCGFHKHSLPGVLTHALLCRGLIFLWALGSGENGKKGLLYLAEVFAGGFRLYERNKIGKKLFRTFFDMWNCVRKKSV